MYKYSPEFIRSLESKIVQLQKENSIGKTEVLLSLIGITLEVLEDQKVKNKEEKLRNMFLKCKKQLENNGVLGDTLC
jgi:hypothetical protein